MLTNYTIWIVDDNIPIPTSKVLDFPRRDEVVAGTRPIDHGLLSRLVDQLSGEYWEDKRVLGLCRQLIESTYKLLAFRHPRQALNFLERERHQPDIIIYDLEYDKNFSDADDLLCEILRNSFSLVHVYTTYDIDFARKRLSEAFKSFYPKRLADPTNKEACTPDGLATILEKRSKESLSFQMAHLVRLSSSAAIERTLIGLDDLALSDTIEILVGNPEEPERLGEQDLVDFVASRIADALEKEDQIQQQLTDYATMMLGKERPTDDSLKEATRLLVSLITSAVRERIQQNSRLLELIKSAAAEATKSKQSAGKTEIPAGDSVSPVEIGSFTRFTSFWMYARPNDDVVRTGDIIKQVIHDRPNQECRSLYLVLTPPCDIERFWVKTRGCLTFAVLEPIQEGRAIEFLNTGGNKKVGFDPKVANIKIFSNSAGGPVLLPAIDIDGKGTFVDYVLFSHMIISWRLSNSDPNDWKKVLTYPILNSSMRPDSVARVVRLSEPFLSGILEHIAGTIFQTGLPSLPLPEAKRINGILTASSNTTMSP